RPKKPANRIAIAAMSRGGRCRPNVTTRDSTTCGREARRPCPSDSEGGRHGIEEKREEVLEEVVQEIIEEAVEEAAQEDDPEEDDAEEAAAARRARHLSEDLGSGSEKRLRAEGHRQGHADHRCAEESRLRDRRRAGARR